MNTPLVMGILNVTPDSFSDGGKYCKLDQAISHALQMEQEGARIIDVGGESTRPNAEEVSLQEELDRVIPVIEKLSQETNVMISIDTSKPVVMHEAVKAGAGMINDIFALQRENALSVAQQCQVPICLMHMQNQPRSMQQNPQYEDIVRNVYKFLEQRIQSCLDAGIPREKLIIDPGFGFGKTVSHNLQLVAHLKEFSTLHVPILLGVSRKSTIGAVLNQPLARDRLAGSLALAAIAVFHGAHIIRAHDVKATVDVIKITYEVLKEKQ